jgi:hypothetical protein
MVAVVADSSQYAASGYGAGLWPVASLDTSLKKFGAGSLTFSGTGSGCAFASSDSRFIMTGDFTVECWVYWPPMGVNAQAVFGFGTSSSSQWYVTRLGGNGALRLSNGAVGLLFTGGTSPTNSTWHHIALTRSGTTMTLWLDGVSQGTSTQAGTILAGAVNLGARDSLSGLTDQLIGNIDEVRVTVGVARYTAGFTPSAVPFGENTTDDPSWNSVVLLLHCDSLIAAPTAKFVDQGVIPLVSPGMHALSYAKLSPDIKVKDVYFGGLGRISGTVKVKGTPDYAVRDRVRLHRQRDGYMMRETWSDATTGAYTFDNVDPAEKYTVITYDSNLSFRAVVADNLTPDAMP